MVQNMPIVPYNNNDEDAFHGQLLDFDFVEMPDLENLITPQGEVPTFFNQSEEDNNGGGVDVINDETWNDFLAKADHLLNGVDDVPSQSQANHLLNVDDVPSQSQADHVLIGVDDIPSQSQADHLLNGIDDVPSQSQPQPNFVDQGINGFNQQVEEMPFGTCPPRPPQFNCTFCNVLRELIHTDGNWMTKLEIHGRLGIVSHCVLETRGSQDSQPEFNMFDFHDKNMEEVKRFLKQYCDEKKRTGYTLVPDPLTAFYETMTVGLDCEGDLSADDFNFDSPLNIGDDDIDLEEEPETSERGARRPRKINLSDQRKRARRMTINDLIPYFHMPLIEAAKTLNMCPTVVKKICRKGGLGRWPQRKIKSVLKQIEYYSKMLDLGNPSDREIAEVKIRELQEILQKLNSGINIK